MRHASSLPLLVGRKPVMEALQQGSNIEKIFLLRSAAGPEIVQIKQLAKQYNIPVSQVPVEKLNGMTHAQHQGIVAWAGLLQYIDLQAAISYTVDQGLTPLFVALDGITDVRNAGAIARTAWCCGAQALILPAGNIASLNEDAIKTSAGALSKLHLCRVPSMDAAIQVLRLNGIQVLGTHMKGSVPIYECDFQVPVAIVMGAEDTGIGRDVLRHADSLIHIPMATSFNSLNVGAAAAMILYEAMKQRMAATV